MATKSVGGSKPATNTSSSAPKKADDQGKKTANDSKVAKNNPQATKTAAKNTFGNLPNGQKQPASNAKNNNAKQTNNGAKNADAKQSGNDTKAPANAPEDGKAPAASKAAPDTAKTPDPQSKLPTPLNQPKTENLAINNGNAKAPAGDPKTAADPKAAADPKTAADPKAPIVTTNQPAIPKTENVTDNANTPVDAPAPAAPAADPKTGTPETDAATPQQNTNQPPTAQPGTDPKAPPTTDPKAPPPAAAPAPAPGEPGSPVKDNQGKDVTTPDGNKVVLDKNKNPVAVDKNGNPVADPKGNPYAVDKNGKYIQTPDGKYAAYDKNGNTIATDANGNPVADPNGNAYAVDKNGKYIQTPDGNPVVYENINGKVAKIATDGNGNPMVINGQPAAVGPDGNYLKTTDGNTIVYDTKGNQVAVDKNGNTITDKNGNPLAIDQNGNYLKTPSGDSIIYDKSTGFKVAVDEMGNILGVGGRPFAIDENGKVIQDANGNNAIYDGAGNVVVQQNMTTPDGYQIYKDMKTGDLETVADNGLTYKIDPKTNDFAKDANGNYLPAVYDPVNSDPTRPPVTPTDNPDTTLKNMPQGKERGDPMVIKDQLFDQNGNLDKQKLYDALAKYDPRDVYDALINSGKSGGWNNMPQNLLEGGTIVHPNEDQARQAIAALMAWQNANGKYNPIQQGKVPSIVFYQGGASGFQGYENDGTVYIDLDTTSNNIAIMETVFHEMNHAHTSDAFTKAFQSPDGAGVGDALVESTTEYLANNWTGDINDGGYEDIYPMAFKKLNDAVMAMGNGDRNKGLDILKRAYYEGDPLAIRELEKYFPPGQSIGDVGPTAVPHPQGRV